MLPPGSRSASAFLIAFALASDVASAEPIDTDGPDFVESSEVVPTGRFQYEADLTASRNGRESVRQPAATAVALLKAGVAPDLEVRVESTVWQRQDGRAGSGDTALGMKWHSHDRDAATGRPAVSWIVHVETPSGSPAFRGQGFRPSLRTVLTWDLPNDFALGLMPGIMRDADGAGRRFTSAIFGAVLNKRLSETLRAFVEFSAPQIAHGTDGGTLASWDVGTAYLLTRDAQLGMRAGVAANRNSPASYVLVELAQRF